MDIHRYLFLLKGKTPNNNKHLDDFYKIEQQIGEGSRLNSSHLKIAGIVKEPGEGCLLYNTKGKFGQQLQYLHFQEANSKK